MILFLVIQVISWRDRVCTGEVVKNQASLPPSLGNNTGGITQNCYLWFGVHHLILLCRAKLAPLFRQSERPKERVSVIVAHTYSSKS